MEGSGRHHAPAALPRGKILWYPLDRRLGGPQSQSERDGDEKVGYYCRESNPGRPARNLVTVLTSYTSSMCFLFSGVSYKYDTDYVNVDIKLLTIERKGPAVAKSV
jgi:hypothetical protein